MFRALTATVLTNSHHDPRSRKKQSVQLRYTLTILAVILIFVLVIVASSLILNVFRLTYRHWVMTVSGFILLLLILLFGCGLIACLQLYKKKFSIFLRISGTLVLLAAMVFVGFWGIFFLSFSIMEEAVTWRNNEKMVAEINAFLDVNVTLYEYKNCFIRGSIVRATEWYGNGAYNPFEKEPIPTPKRAVYYDTNGNFTSGINDDQDQATENIPATSEASKETMK